jgi:hypothetical protein
LPVFASKALKPLWILAVEEATWALRAAMLTAPLAFFRFERLAMSICILSAAGATAAEARPRKGRAARTNDGLKCMMEENRRVNLIEDELKSAATDDRLSNRHGFCSLGGVL